MGHPTVYWLIEGIENKFKILSKTSSSPLLCQHCCWVYFQNRIKQNERSDEDKDSIGTIRYSWRIISLFAWCVIFVKFLSCARSAKAFLYYDKSWWSPRLLSAAARQRLLICPFLFKWPLDVRIIDVIAGCNLKGGPFSDSNVILQWRGNSSIFKIILSIGNENLDTRLICHKDQA